MARDTSSSTLSSQSPRGVPSGSRENMTGPDEGRGPGDRLQGAGLDDLGESVEDQQRDRDSRGTGDYDDSIGRRRGEADTDRSGTTRGD